MPISYNVNSQLKQDKRFQVYVKANIRKVDPATSSIKLLFFNTVYADDPTVTGTSYEAVNSSSEEPWVLVCESSSYKYAKSVYNDKVAIYGKDYVKLVRVIDVE